MLDRIVIAGAGRAIGRDLNLIDEAAESCLVLVAMLVSILFPVAVKLIAPRPPGAPRGLPSADGR